MRPDLKFNVEQALAAWLSAGQGRSVVESDDRFTLRETHPGTHLSVTVVKIEGESRGVLVVRALNRWAAGAFDGE